MLVVITIYHRHRSSGIPGTSLAMSRIHDQNVEKGEKDILIQ